MRQYYPRVGVAQWFAHLTRNLWMSVRREFQTHQRLTLSKKLHPLNSLTTSKEWLVKGTYLLMIYISRVASFTIKLKYVSFYYVIHGLILYDATIKLQIIQWSHVDNRFTVIRLSSLKYKLSMSLHGTPGEIHVLT